MWEMPGIYMSFPHGIKPSWVLWSQGTSASTFKIKSQSNFAAISKHRPHSDIYIYPLARMVSLRCNIITNAAPNGISFTERKYFLCVPVNYKTRPLPTGLGYVYIFGWHPPCQGMWGERSMFVISTNIVLRIFAQILGGKAPSRVTDTNCSSEVLDSHSCIRQDLEINRPSSNSVTNALGWVSGPDVVTQGIQLRTR